MKSFLLFLLSFGVLNAASYVVPQEYDNMKNSIDSIKSEIISEATPTLSTATYTIGSFTANYRCLIVPKITCRGATLKMLANQSEVNLKNASNEIVPTYASDIRLEDDATNYYVCAAAVGGDVWDTVTSVASVVTYTPLNQRNVAPYFTNSASSINSASSFIKVEHKQVCQ